MDAWRALFGRLTSGRSRRAKRSRLRIALLTLALLFLIPEGLVIGFPFWSKPASADVIIVLGANVDARGPKPFYRARLDEAVRLYEAGYAPVIITTGGQGPTEPISEGIAGRDYLIARGVPPEAIVAETSSSSTLENLLHARRIMAERGDATAIIVSNRFHLFRAMLLARFTEVEASYAGVFVGEYWPEEIVGHLREVPAIYFNALRGLWRLYDAG